MTEQELQKNVAKDLKAVLEEARSMGCTEVKAFHHIPLKNVAVVVDALERQIEINNMALVQSHRKCVLGRDEMYSDSTLQSMSKAELINLLHVAQHNYSVLLETLDGRVKYYEKELAAMSDEIKFEEE